MGLTSRSLVIIAVLLLLHFVRVLSLDVRIFIITAVAFVIPVVAGIIPCKKDRGGCERHSRVMLERRLTHLHAPRSGPTILAPARSLSIVLLFLVTILFADLIFKCIWRLCGALSYRWLGRADQSSRSPGL